MVDYTAKYPGRAMRERWVIDSRNIPIKVQAFECPNSRWGEDDPWLDVWCPEVGCSWAYEDTYDNSHDAWEEAKRRNTKKKHAFNNEQEAFEKAYRER